MAAHLRSHGLDPVFIGAAADDLSPFREFRTISGAPLSEIKRLLASASLFVGNDSGPAHMAAAFGVPVVVDFRSLRSGDLGTLAHGFGNRHVATRHRRRRGREFSRRWRVCGCPHERTRPRFSAYARRYWPHLLASIVLMAIAGAAQGALALLVRPIFDRVLTAERPGGLTPLLAKPVFGHQLYLEQVVPLHGRSIWFMVAFALIAVSSSKASAITLAIT